MLPARSTPTGTASAPSTYLSTSSASPGMPRWSGSPRSCTPLTYPRTGIPRPRALGCMRSHTVSPCFTARPIMTSWNSRRPCMTPCTPGVRIRFHQHDHQERTVPADQMRFHRNPAAPRATSSGAAARSPMTSSLAVPSGHERRQRDASEASPAGAPDQPAEWVLLSYRLPREPSGPRSAVWRKLRKLCVAQISDGLVALPAGPRTREQMEWLSEEVIDSGGAAIIWLATPSSRAQERQLARAMAEARVAEYEALIAAAEAAAASQSQATALRRLRNDLRAIQRRDYFPPAERDQAEAAVQALAPVPPRGGRAASRDHAAGTAP